MKRKEERPEDKLKLSKADGPIEPPPSGATARKALWISQEIGRVVGMFSTAGDADEILKKLGKTRKDLIACEADDEVTQVFDTRREALLATPWRIEHDDIEMHDWIHNQVEANYEAIVGGAFGAVGYGYSIVRPVYDEPEDGAPSGALVGGIQMIDELRIEDFDLNGEGKWRHKNPDSGTFEVLEPWMEDYLYFITVRKRTQRQPYGEALMSRVYWPYFFRYNGWRFWMAFLERFGSPMLLGNAADGDTDALAEELAKAVQDAVVAVGAEDKVTAIQVSGSGEAFAKADDALVRRIQRLVLGQTLTSDVGDKGSYAAANIHNLVRLDKRNADIRLVTPTVQRIVRALTVLRFGLDVEVPKFVIEDETGIQKDRAERDATLLNAKALRLTRGYFERAYDLEDDDFVMPGEKGYAAEGTGEGEEEEQGEGQEPAGGSLSATLSALLAKRGQRFTDDQEFLETFLQEALGKIGSPITRRKIEKEVRLAKDEGDLARRLLSLYRNRETADWEAQLAGVQFAADVFGYVAASNE